MFLAVALWHLGFRISRTVNRALEVLKENYVSEKETDTVSW